MPSWPVFCAVLMLWRCGACFQLHDILRDLQTENAYLHSKVENMTEMLMELKFYIWNNSRGWCGDLLDKALGADKWVFTRECQVGQAPAPEHLQDSAFCKQDTIWSGSSNMIYPVRFLILATQAFLSLLSN